MSRWLCTLLLACAASAQAAPSSNSYDDVDRLIAEKGLITRFEDVGHKVADKAKNVADNASNLVTDVTQPP